MSKPIDAHYTFLDVKEGRQELRTRLQAGEEINVILKGKLSEIPPPATTTASRSSSRSNSRAPRRSDLSFCTAPRPRCRPGCQKFNLEILI